MTGTLVSQSSHAGVRLYEGMLEGEACTVMKSGVGKGSCAMTLTIALERLGSVDAVINIGTAGGILDTEEVLDLVISTAVVQHDYDTSPIDGEDGIGLWFEADARLQRAASEAARQLSLRVHHGAVAKRGECGVVKCRQQYGFNQFRGL